MRFGQGTRGQFGYGFARGGGHQQNNITNTNNLSSARATPQAQMQMNASQSQMNASQSQMNMQTNISASQHIVNPQPSSWWSNQLNADNQPDNPMSAVNVIEAVRQNLTGQQDAQSSSMNLLFQQANTKLFDDIGFDNGKQKQGCTDELQENENKQQQIALELREALIEYSASLTTVAFSQQIKDFEVDTHSVFEQIKTLYNMVKQYSTLQIAGHEDLRKKCRDLLQKPYLSILETLRVSQEDIIHRHRFPIFFLCGELMLNLRDVDDEEKENIKLLLVTQLIIDENRRESYAPCYNVFEALAQGVIRHIRDQLNDQKKYKYVVGPLAKELSVEYDAYQSELIEGEDDVAVEVYFAKNVAQQTELMLEIAQQKNLADDKLDAYAIHYYYSAEGGIKSIQCSVSSAFIEAGANKYGYEKICDKKIRVCNEFLNLTQSRYDSILAELKSTDVNTSTIINNVAIYYIQTNFDVHREYFPNKGKQLIVFSDCAKSACGEGSSFVDKLLQVLQAGGLHVYDAQELQCALEKITEKDEFVSGRCVFDDVGEDGECIEGDGEVRTILWPFAVYKQWFV